MLKAYVETFKKYQYLLANLISRDLKVKYRRSVLGIMWSLLNPILMMLILGAVFKQLFNNYSVEHFELYLITGQTLFTFFNEATSGGLESIVMSSALMKKVYVPKYVFPIEKVLYAFVNLCFSLTAVTIMLFVFRVPFSVTMLLIPIPLFALLLFTAGFSLLLSALYAFFRDTKHLYGVVLLAWMYLTPIIYPLSMVENEPVIGTVVRLNPMTWFITAFRNLFLYSTLPDLKTVLICYIWGVVMVITGLVVFKKTQDRFVLHI